MTKKIALDIDYAHTVRGAINQYFKLGEHVGDWTPVAMRENASVFTGKVYPRSRAGLALALTDMNALLGPLDYPKTTPVKKASATIVYVVMGEGDNAGTRPESTIRVFDTFAGAKLYAKELYDEFYSFVSIATRELESEQ